MTRVLLLAVVLACYGFPQSMAAPGLKEAPSDLKKLEGDWTIESWVQLGQAIRTQASWTFKTRIRVQSSIAVN